MKLFAKSIITEARLWRDCFLKSSRRKLFVIGKKEKCAAQRIYFLYKKIVLSTTHNTIAELGTCRSKWTRMPEYQPERPSSLYTCPSVWKNPLEKISFWNFCHSLRWFQRTCILFYSFLLSISFALLRGDKTSSKRSFYKSPCMWII